MHGSTKGLDGHEPDGAAERRKSRVGYVQQMVALLFMAGLLWLLFGQGSPIAGTGKPGIDAAESDTAATADGATDSVPGAREIPRPWVAATSPAITDTLVELGLIAHLVGRSPYCRSVPTAMPVVGDLRDFNAERLAIARPDVLFVQPPLAGVDPALREFCTSKGIRLVERRIDSFAETRALVADIADVFRATPAKGAAGVAGRLAEADADLSVVAEAADEPRDAMPKVLLLVSSEPFLAVGAGNYLDELLAANGLGNALPREGWSEVSAESIAALAPGAILGVVESEAGAARMSAAIRSLPWPEGSSPRFAVAVLPELLAPSLVAARRRGALADLYGKAIAPTSISTSASAEAVDDGEETGP
ncbi:MAG: ABC transporter substrate-binding protein [Planctomycetaceae bacterium]|nr:ABC transporter substrate-binding protein [Planctomycetaceae bacterium]